MNLSSKIDDELSFLITILLPNSEKNKVKSNYSDYNNSIQTSYKVL